MEELASIPLFFRHRDVLVTGGSGFVGRVLVEKLLRSCPDVGTVFLLLRPRKGVAPLDRLAKLTGVELFDRLREEQPGALSKLRVVAGDTSQPGLGLSAEDAEMLVERVSVVFNLAASVRFDDPLDKAVRMNVVSAHSMMQLAVRMTQLKALVHVSTTYCNRGETVYDEKLYPPPADWRSLVKVVETADPYVLSILTDKIVGEYRSTYSYTKILAEHVINEFADRIPIAIFRPAVVVGTAFEPVPGWIDNFNGPIALLVGAAKGIVHNSLNDPNMKMDFIPCDMIVKGIIICSCEIAKAGAGESLIYQGAEPDFKILSHDEVIRLAESFSPQVPFNDIIYYPSGGCVKHPWQYYIQYILSDLLLAIIVDFALKASGHKPLLVRLQRRIYIANRKIYYGYTRYNWHFINKRYKELENKLAESDKCAFRYRTEEVDVSRYMLDQIIGIRHFLLKEKDEDLPHARKRLKRQRLLHLTLKTLFYICISWIAYNQIYAVLFRN